MVAGSQVSVPFGPRVTTRRPRHRALV